MSARHTDESLKNSYEGDAFAEAGHVPVAEALIIYITSYAENETTLTAQSLSIVRTSLQP